MRRKHLIFMALGAALALAGLPGCGKGSAPAPAGLSAPIALVEIPPGEFLMGSPEDEAGRYRDETRHPVRITYAFKMGKYEVTQRQWREVMGATIRQQRDKVQREVGELTPLGQRVKYLGEAIRDNPYGAFEVIKEQGVWRTLIKWLAVGEERWPLSGEGDDYPMYYVSWNEATEFCARLTEQERAAGRLPAGMAYRLPTEAEWEYACRAGSTTRFANGDAESDLDKIAWYEVNSGGTTHPVGTKRPNTWGLHDLHGNVREGCHDWYGKYPSGGSTDPQGASSGSSRVGRGGSWRNDAARCRSAYRSSWYLSRTIISLGFRVSLAPQVPVEAP